MVRAAVFLATGDEKAQIQDVDVIGPGPGEVRVRIRATGVCHSDLHAMSGTLPQPAPCVLGHEGAGEVIAVGQGVESVAEGDRAIVSWMPACGACRWCHGGQPYLCMTLTLESIHNPRFRVGDTPYFGVSGTGTFAEEVVLPEQAVIGLPDDVPFEVGALIGCGVMTGVGSAINVARILPGSSVAVIGCGGVGISAIQGARVAGAAEIVAVDTVPQKLQWARQFGATHAVGPGDVETAKQEITEGLGFDYVLEVVGTSGTIRQAYDLTRRGGTTVIVGAGSVTDTVEFNAFELFFTDRTIKSSVYGGANAVRDFGRIVRLWRSGQLDLEGMISRRLPLDDVNDAFEALRAGEVIRQVIIF
jgi:S-(hydroxymethyl)glutathione dehydrogenase / alcohol dehydrogenase